MNNMKDMMKAAQKMQDRMQKMQEELNMRTIDASAGGGMVKAVVTGGKMLKEITIHPEAVDLNDIEMLQDLIIIAVNEALRKSEEMVNAEMGKVTSGLKLPPGLF
ncbi:MAG: YbaB/EbfC family nucleoid-associated protein [Firmicutes bacterium]|nr:YbaB/EbfC family nucleoid-associated protein [Dethiobacter sp.]MBS3888319.1 YbaB/EbfC family nucleoid-associated protein [Bacillota bacterium]MBS4055429.1 YbaB/EbfC family nucleoid-associated protein [Thermaerobacter sp.]